jgi:hypothetical protein
MNIFKIVFLVIISIQLVSCNEEILSDDKKEPDYSNSDCWASLPESIVKDVDVFFVYPTLFGGTGKMNMDITSDEMRMRVQSVLLKQSSVFNTDCNIYAPYYRQMAMDGLTMDQNEREIYFRIGLNDTEKAFDYYINHLNNGRPFILAGHSQGSQVLINLLKGRFNKPELMDKLVAAYLIGYSLTDNDLMQCSWLKIAQTSDDTGVIITYNTQSANAEGSPVLLSNAKCVNPLNWKNNSEYAPKEMHLGAVFFKDNGEVDSTVFQFTDAWVDENGALVPGLINSDLYSTDGFPVGVYHKYDYSFFYNNLKQNAGDRIKAYFNKNK